MSSRATKERGFFPRGMKGTHGAQYSSDGYGRGPLSPKPTSTRVCTRTDVLIFCEAHVGSARIIRGPNAPTSGIDDITQWTKLECYTGVLWPGSAQVGRPCGGAGWDHLWSVDHKCRRSSGTSSLRSDTWFGAKDKSRKNQLPISWRKKRSTFMKYVS